MAAPAILKVDVITDASKATAGLGKASSAAEGFGRTLKRVALAAGGAFAVREVVQFGVASVKAAEESQVATRKLANVFAQAGDASGKAARAAEDYASALSMKIGVEDEAIMSAQALLVTFHDVSSEAARNAGVFDRATKAAADLAANGMGSMEGNAVSLGKALQDPTKGVARLTKQGVNFTDAQKDAIKAMQESGDLLGAQNLILAEVEAQVGGTAEATATASGKMSVAFGEVQETIGNALLPVVAEVSTALTGFMQNVLPALADALRPAMQSVLGFAQGVVSWFVANWPKIQATAVTVFQTIRSVVMPIVKRLADYFTNTLWPALSGVFDSLRDLLPKVADAIADVQPIAERVFGILMSAVEDVTPIVGGLIEKIAELVGWLIDNRDEVLLITAPLIAYGAVLGTIAIAQGLWNTAITIGTAAQTAFNAVMAMNPVMAIVLGIMALIGVIVLLVKNWDKVKAAFMFVFEWVKKNWPLLLAILTGPIGLAVLAIVRNWDTIKNAVTGVFDKIKELATGAWRWVTDKFQQIADKVTGTFNTVRDTINGFIRGWNRLRVPKVEFDIPGGSLLPGVPDSVSVGGWDLPNIPLLAQGGAVMRTGLAIVHAGEQFSGVGKTFGGSTVINVAVTTAGLGADAPEIQRAVVRALRGHVARNGPLDVPVRTVA